MKIRDSGMPDDAVWEGFFNPEEILAKMHLDGSISVAVDFGFGYGTFSIPASKIVREKVIGFDIDPEMLNHTEALARKSGARNLELILRDFITQGTGLPDNSVDYVMLFNILHAENPDLLLNEAFRILKQKGRVGIIHWNYDPTTPRGPEIKIRPKPGQCREWAESAGFRIIEPKIDLPPYHYGIVGVKSE